MTTAAPSKTADQKRAKAYAAAEKAIRERHAGEFADLYQAECVKAGIAYKPRLNPQQKAEREITRLLAEFPELADQMRVQPLIDFPDQD